MNWLFLIYIYTYIFKGHKNLTVDSESYSQEKWPQCDREPSVSCPQQEVKREKSDEDLLMNEPVILPHSNCSG